jgi:hypothetical protein
LEDSLKKSITLIIVFTITFTIFMGCFIFTNRLPTQDETQSECEPINEREILEESFEFIVDEYSLIVNHFNAMRHCGYKIKFKAELDDNTIIIRETDLATAQAGCTCYLDFSVTIPGLESGAYHVELWREDNEILAEEDISID